MSKPRSHRGFGKTSLSTPWGPSREGTSGGTKHLNGPALCSRRFWVEPRTFVSRYPKEPGLLLFSAHQPS